MDPTVLIVGGMGLLAMAKPKEPTRGLPVQAPGMIEGPQWELYRAARVPGIGLKIPQPTAPAPPSLGDVLKATAGQVAKKAVKAGIQVGVKKVAAPALAAAGKALLGKLGLGAGAKAGMSAAVSGTGATTGLAAAAVPIAVIAAPLVIAGGLAYQNYKSGKRRKKKQRKLRAYWGGEMQTWSKAEAMAAAEGYAEYGGVWQGGNVPQKIAGFQWWTRPGLAKYDPEVAAAFQKSKQVRAVRKTMAEAAKVIAALPKRGPPMRGETKKPIYTMVARYKGAPTLALAEQIIQKAKPLPRLGRD